MTYHPFALILLTLSPSLYAADFGNSALGKMKSPSCVFCHNPTSPSTNSTYPNLSGQDPLYLFNAMKAYQNGDRQGDYADMMRAQLSKLNDQDLKDITAFYSSQDSE
ncbi:cytochrome c [Vibrio gigantis]|uniref:c-type cytochrome n=1 Tax=Vibrio TaxID=662 RepID=UPI002E18BECB|nr:cytochrome c [Vibrio crassostreae]